MGALAIDDRARVTKSMWTIRFTRSRVQRRHACAREFGDSNIGGLVTSGVSVPHSIAIASADTRLRMNPQWFAAGPGGHRRYQGAGRHASTRRRVQCQPQSQFAKPELQSRLHRYRAKIPHRARIRASNRHPPGHAIRDLPAGTRSPAASPRSVPTRSCKGHGITPVSCRTGPSDIRSRLNFKAQSWIFIRRPGSRWSDSPESSSAEYENLISGEHELFQWMDVKDLAAGTRPNYYPPRGPRRFSPTSVTRRFPLVPASQRPVAGRDLHLPRPRRCTGSNGRTSATARARPVGRPPAVRRSRDPRP